MAEWAKSDQRIAGPHPAGRVLTEAQGAHRIAGWIDLLKLVVGWFWPPVQAGGCPDPQCVGAVDVDVGGCDFGESLRGAESLPAIVIESDPLPPAASMKAR